MDRSPLGCSGLPRARGDGQTHRNGVRNSRAPARRRRSGATRLAARRVGVAALDERRAGCPEQHSPCHISAVNFGIEPASAAWARLIGLSALGALQVVVDPDSWLAPRGWIGILVMGTTITASVPTTDLQAPVTSAPEGLTGDEVTTLEVVMSRIPPTSSSLGPALLFYPPSGFVVSSDEANEASAGELSELLGAVGSDDLEESGIAHIESPVFVSRAPGGAVIATCGYRRWPNGVAHLSALTHPAWRKTRPWSSRGRRSDPVRYRT